MYVGNVLKASIQEMKSLQHLAMYFIECDKLTDASITAIGQGLQEIENGGYSPYGRFSFVALKANR